jgi:hypothetical protein
VLFNVQTLQLKFYTVLLSLVVLTALTPMAFAQTAPQNIVKAGDYVTLLGVGTDIDNDDLKFAWKQVSGETVQLSSYTSETPSFVAPEVENGKVKILVFELTVTDPYGGSNTDVLRITVMPRNQPPTADAGPDQTVEKGTVVRLQGDGSDPDGDALMFRWSQLDGPLVTLDDATSRSPSFDTSEISRSSATVRFQLTVSDGFGGLARDSVTIRVTAERPTLITANAGPDQTVNEGDNVRLNGSCDDKLDRPVTATWSQTLGPFSRLSSTSALDPVFVAPEIPNGPIVPTAFRLTCYVEGAGTATDLVIIRVKPVNDAPTADAGPDKNTLPNRLVYLTGSGTDPDGDILRFTWKQTSGPEVQLQNANRAEAKFIAPRVSGGASLSLEFELTVTDPSGASANDSAKVTVVSDNVRASADAGLDQTVDEQTPVTLFGAGIDPDSSALTYTWKQIGGEAVTLSATDVAQPTFTAPEVANGQIKVLVFELRVADESGYPGKDITKVTVLPVNIPPVVDAGDDQTVEIGETVTLVGTAHDDDNDPLTYLWTQVGGPSVTLSTTTDLTTTFTAPKTTETTNYTFQLIANDGQADSEPSTVTITVNGEATKALFANAGRDQTVQKLTTVTLSGTGSDPLRHALSFNWRQLTGETVTLSADNVNRPTFVAPDVPNGQQRLLTFEFTVSDPSTGRTAKDTVVITVLPVNTDPTATASVKSVREPV